MIGFFVNNIDFRGGLEIVTERLCDLFNESGISAKIYSLNGEKYSEVNYLGINGKISETDFDSIFSKFRNDGVDRLIVQLDNPFSPVSNIKFLEYIISKGILVVCCIHTSPVYFAKRFWNHVDSKIIFFLKSLKTYLYYKKRAKIYFSRCQKNGIGLISLCEGNRNELKKLFGVDSFVIPNFYKIKQFDKTEIERKKNTISYIGRIDYGQKNLFTLLDSWNKVREKKDWILNIVGGGDKSNLMSYIDKYSIKNINVCDFMDSYEIESLYKSNSVLILTSHFEGYPTVIVEAVSYANAVITTRYAGFSDELVKNGINGFVTGFNSDEIANCIQKLIIDEKLLNRMQFASYENREKLEKINYISLWTETFEKLRGRK